MNKQRFRLRVQRLERTVHHRGVEMAARAGVDLNRTRPGRPDSLGVEQGFLVTFDDRRRVG